MLAAAPPGAARGRKVAPLRGELARGARAREDGVRKGAQRWRLTHTLTQQSLALALAAAATQAAAGRRA
jgi:hypothetical protein